MDRKIIQKSFTFNDVLLIPAKSPVIPKNVNVKTKLTRNIELNLPIISAAMDTVTESRLAIAISREGGIGIIHKNLGIEQQANEVKKVKRSESVVVKNPITLEPSASIRKAIKLMTENNISGIPITTSGRKLVGILTNRDLRFETNLDKTVAELMTKDNLITAPESIGITQAKQLLHKNRIEKLLMVDGDYNLKGLLTVKDIMKSIKFPNAAKDKRGQLLVGAAVGVSGDFLERANELIRARADVIIVDTAHGHSTKAIAALKKLRGKYPEQDFIAGNVATAEATKDLILAGADGVKIGIGPGSICTTRIIAGVGVPQLSAILNCVKAAENRVPIIADGGIKYSGDIAKAIAAGANSVMIGSLFAGTDESPGEDIIYEGRRFKSYRGMGSISAMKAGSKDRYFQDGMENEFQLNSFDLEKEGDKLVAEGIEGRVEYKGPIAKYLYQLIGGLKAGMGYCGAPDIETMREFAKFTQITNASLIESHPHDVIITKEAPNYQR
ncbi:MAG: IMP dehydrogenase [Candidatus Cloacimonadota bacterium]|nr:IMP dehydrogenase [Candidatus Cloacimonadota bacterium]